MLDRWNHLPHWIQSIIVGNILQVIAVETLRKLSIRYHWLQPLLNRLGPKSLRVKQPPRAGEGLLIGICWFALSWYVGHSALRCKSRISAWLLHRQ